MHSQTKEDYLKHIFDLHRREGKVTTSALSARLSVAPASVTGMIKKLAEEDLITYEPYQGVELTSEGQKIALKVIRNHRLVELYLVKALEMPWDVVHAEAEKWEHILSARLEARMDLLLGYPTVDPHGAPIPTVTGEIAPPYQTRLSDMPVGNQARIAEVPDETPEILHLLAKRKLRPGTLIIVISNNDEAVTYRVGNQICKIGQPIAKTIYVTDIQAE